LMKIPSSFPPPKKVIKFHPFKIFFEGAYPTQVCPPETLSMVLCKRLTIVAALQNWKNKHLVAVCLGIIHFGGGEKIDEPAQEQTRKYEAREYFYSACNKDP
jgi:hypothetical protein